MSMSLIKHQLWVVALFLLLTVCSAEEEAKIEILQQWVPPECTRKVKTGDSVRYHYYGMLTDGTYFDSSFERGRTYNTLVNSGWLIPGMDQALLGMCLNEHRIVSIPPQLAYGEDGTDEIPGGATLLFNFVLLDISNEEDEIQITTTYLPPDCKRHLNNTDFVRYHYNGTLLNGKTFHTSYDEGRTYDTYIGSGWLIRGMDIGLLGSCMGERRTIIIPPHLAYGARGDDKNIPPAAMVRFDVEIIDFHNPKDEAVTENLDAIFKPDPTTGDDPCPRRIESSDFVRYHYNGTLMDGTIFDTSYRRNRTYDTYVGFKRVIAGMEFSLLGMCVGDTTRITIPPHLGYGEEGVEGVIPGSAVIIFDVFVVDVHNPKDKVVFEVIKAAEECSRKAANDDFLTYDYELELMDGTKIDSSKDTPGPWATYIGRGKVVYGLEQALIGMCVGEVRRAIVPPHFGFGEDGVGNIPGSAVLIYTLELHKIEDSLPEGFSFMWNGGKEAPKNLFSLMDEDSDGQVSVDEFASYILREVDSGEARILPGVDRDVVVQEFFKELDSDANGSLSKAELKIPLPSEDKLGEKMGDEL